MVKAYENRESDSTTATATNNSSTRLSDSRSIAIILSELSKYNGKFGGNVYSDPEYLRAVENNDEETMARMVDEAARAAGYTQRVYHQTGAEFTEFNTENEGAGKYDSETPTDMFFKPTDADNGLKGKKQMPVYLNAHNMKEFNDRAEMRAFWEENIDDYKDAIDERKALDAKMQAKHDQLDKAIDEYYKDNFRAIRADDPTVTAELERMQKEDDDLIQEWTTEGEKLDRKAKELINDFIEKSDYDGIHILNDAGGIGKTATESYIVFDPRQVKSAETVTRDDSGNVIPLSERFKTDNKDIRYSLTSSSD